MIDRVTKGEDPSPPGYIARPPTQAKISAAATKIATDEANATATRLAKEKKKDDARKATKEERKKHR